MRKFLYGLYVAGGGIYILDCPIAAGSPRSGATICYPPVSIVIRSGVWKT